MLFRISLALDLDSSLLDAAKASHESAKLTWPPVNKCGKKEKTTHTKWLSVRILRKLLLELEGFTFNDSSLYYFCYFNNHSKHRCMVKIVESSFNCNLLYEFMQLELIQPEGYTSQLCNYCADKMYCISVFVETSVKTMKPWIFCFFANWNHAWKCVIRRRQSEVDFWSAQEANLCRARWAFIMVADFMRQLIIFFFISMLTANNFSVGKPFHD